MTPPVWVLNKADGEWHAVPAEGVLDEAALTYVALCGLSIPVEHATVGDPAPQFMHRSCLIRYGQPMSYNPTSEEG